MPFLLRDDLERKDTAAWLNYMKDRREAAATAAYARVCEILNLTDQLFALSAQLARLRGPARNQAMRARALLTVALNRRLRRYIAFPVVRSADRFTHGWSAVDSRRSSVLKREVRLGSGLVVPYEVSEADVVRNLLEWQATGWERPLAPCEHGCHTWMYRRKGSDRFCSRRCRQAEHARSPEFKAKRARYMREDYRPKEAERNRKALKRARA